VGADFSGDELHLINVDDGAEVVVPLADSSNPPAWAPDSSAVALTGREVLLVSASGDVTAKTEARLRCDGCGAVVDVYAGWSPDGDEFAFITNHQVVVLSAASGHARESSLATLSPIEIDPDAYVVVWYWDSPTTFVVGQGILDYVPTWESPPMLRVEAALEPARVESIDQLPPPHISPGWSPTREWVEVQTDIAAEFGVNDLASFGMTTDGSAYLFALGDRDARVFLRDVRTNETIEVDLGQFAGSVGAYVGE
jgi:hypothetical protein